ncbi:hypothetical protein [Streptomyces sp. NPDC003247]|uniref:hypothetical protein n=1 Tax=Streptomyces sp. NPDC003247 TaxID=3364677 RepID=UPI0036C8E4DC
MSAPADKASGKLRDGALDAQHAVGDLAGHRPLLLTGHDAAADGTAYRAELSELSARVDQPVLSDAPVLQHALQPPDSWWADLAGALEVSAVDTDRVRRTPAVHGAGHPRVRGHSRPGRLLLDDSP